MHGLSNHLNLLLKEENQNERFVNEREARAERDFTPDIQQRLDEDTDDVKVDAVSKDSFYNILLPGTRVREIDPDSIHICIKKSSDWTKENPKYLMMNLKTKEKKEIMIINSRRRYGLKTLQNIGHCVTKHLTLLK